MIGGVTEALADPDASVWHQEADLSDPDSPARLIESAAATSRFLDILVCNHARSGGDGPLGTLTAEMLDAHWAVNTRASILLAQAFAAQHDDSRPGGRIVFMTSGQDLGPMTGEVAYAASKGALASITQTLADQLAEPRHHAEHGQPRPGRHRLRRVCSSPTRTRSSAATSRRDAGAPPTTPPA